MINDPLIKSRAEEPRTDTHDEVSREDSEALQGLGVRLHEIQPARLTYPTDGPMSGYCHHHPDPVVLVYWLTDEILPSIEQAIARYQRVAG